jgi:hypothetical protein
MFPRFNGYFIRSLFINLKASGPPFTVFDIGDPNFFERFRYLMALATSMLYNF